MFSGTEIHNKSIHNNDLKKFVKNLRDGDQKTIPNDKIFLVLGVTGTGKSTLVQFIAGDNTKLYSIDPDEDGEFLIVDGNHIGNSTITSKTTVPERIYDPKTDTHFYDCPGFSDTRSAYMDITATYLIKKLINQSKYIKIAFTVNYPSVRKNVDRHSFMEFVTHAINVIKNIEKYCNSIALVVTKVDYEYVRGKKVSDNIVIKKIGNFLVKVRDEQQEKLDALDIGNQKERSFYKRTIDFINCLATKENGHYNRIALFRRPDDTGPLSELVTLQEGKKKILELLHQKLRYIKLAPRDFGFTISNESKNHAYEIIQYLSDEVYKSISVLIDKMKSAYKLQIKKNFENFQMLNVKFNKDYGRTLTTIEMINDSTSVDDFLLKLLGLLDDLMLEIPESDFQDLIELNSYINFLQMFNKNNLKTRLYRLKETLTSFENFVHEWELWMLFLYKTYIFLSDYSVQNNKDLMNDTYKALNNGNYIEYLKTVDTFDKQILNDLSRIEVDELKKSMLDNLIKLKMQTKVEKTCPSVNKIRIQGEFIKFSEIESVHCWTSKVNSIEIFASDTIYIDADFINNKMKVHNLTIIAPTWNVIGNRQIILDGNPGPTPSVIQAKSGTYSSVDGQDGLPGKPGKAGGSFLGIGMKFINSENLRITANGGAGGSGQNGGNGADGVNGKKASLPDGYVYGECPEWNFTVTNGEYHYTVPTMEVFLFVAAIANFKYEGHGTTGTKGGNGGDGGRGGLGGNPGEIKIIELEEPSKITTEMNNGVVGSPGIGGQGGLGGWNSKTFVECRHKMIFPVAWTNWSELAHIDRFHQLENGLSGQTGANALNLEYPESGTVISDPSIIINSYKEFMKQKLKNNYRRDYLINFLQKFETNMYIQKYSKTLEFNIESEVNKTSHEYRSPYKGIRLNLISNNLDEEIENLRTRRSIKFKTLYDSGENLVTPFKNCINWFIPKSNSAILHAQIDSNNLELLGYNEQHTESGSETLSYDLNFNQHNFNSILLLGDLLIRKLTNGKYYQPSKCSEISHITAQALTLNILDEYEKLLRENIPNEFLLNYDPIRIQKEIRHLIISNRCSDIPKFLTDVAITYNFNSRQDYDAFSQKVYNICENYLTI